jgi:uncharacterized protein
LPKSGLYELDNGKIRPSKALAEALSGLMKGKPEFVLIDDQKSIFESALAAASEASIEAPKVLIIEGGPGTGKTVLAINLLVRLTALKLLSKYVSKNAAPRKVYESKLVGTVKRSHFSNFFPVREPSSIPNPIRMTRSSLTKPTGSMRKAGFMETWEKTKSRS